MTAEQNPFGGESLDTPRLGRAESRRRHRTVLLAALTSLVALAGCQALEFGNTVAERLSRAPPAPAQVAANDDAVVIDGVRFVPSSDPGDEIVGVASWYGPGFNGRRTANGETFSGAALTAAHPSWDMPSLVRVTNLENGRTLVLRINDRGPVYGNRVIDVSERGAELLGFKSSGVVEVRVERLEPEILFAELPVGMSWPANGRVPSVDDQVAELIEQELIPDEVPVILGQDPAAR